MSEMSQTPPGRFHKAMLAIRSRLPELNFIIIHYAYFIITSLCSALIFWGSSTPFGSVSFVDSLFLTTSAMTEAGLNTVNLSQINTWQQVILFFLMMIGSTIFVSAFILFVRLGAFEKAFGNLKQERRERREKRRSSGASRRKSFFSRRQSGPARPPIRMQDDGHPFGVEKVPSQATGSAISPNGFRRQSAMNNANVQASATGSVDPRTNLPAFAEEKEQEKEEHQGQEDASGPHESASDEATLNSSNREFPTPSSQISPRINFSHEIGFGRHIGDLNFSDVRRRTNRPLFSFSGVGANSTASLRTRSVASARPQYPRSTPLPSLHHAPTTAYFLSGGWISRNSQFNGLTTEERLLLGGCEYKAVLFLSFLVPFYFIIWQLLAAISLGAYVYSKRAETAELEGLSPFWVGSFNAVSAFNNCGLSLLNQNMIAFHNSIFMLISMGLLILAGNTAFPIFLRGAVWVLWKILPDDPAWSEEKQTLQFLLDHPRRVFTNMFPSRHTWWLLGTLIVLNGSDWALFPLLNIGNPKIDGYLTPGLEAIDGLFQAIAVRSAGLYVVPFKNFRISQQFLYGVMMYISVYPVVISIRNSNVYEEKSLGLYVEDLEDSDEDDEDVEKHLKREQTHASPLSPGQFREALKRPFSGTSKKASSKAKHETRSYFVRHQLRAQLAHDSWFVAFATFLILIIEASNFEAHPVSFSVFNVLFETVSAYSTVGLSVGVPYNSFSFSGSWHTLSKLILIVVMLRGRHRGLPVAIDHAVQLPGMGLYDAEHEEGERRLDRIERNNITRSRNCSQFARSSPPSLGVSPRGHKASNAATVGAPATVLGMPRNTRQLGRPAFPRVSTVV